MEIRLRLFEMSGLQRKSQLDDKRLWDQASLMQKQEQVLVEIQQIIEHRAKSLRNGFGALAYTITKMQQQKREGDTFDCCSRRHHIRRMQPSC